MNFSNSDSVCGFIIPEDKANIVQLSLEYCNSDDYEDIPTFFPEYSSEYVDPICNWE